MHSLLKDARDRSAAEKILAKLKHDTDEYSESDDLLDAGFRRLWNMNAVEDDKHLSSDLFQLVEASAYDFTPTDLREALRIVDDNTYNAELTTARVNRLYVNFLEVVEERLCFVNNSARKFALVMTHSDDAEIIGAGKQKRKVFLNKGHLKFAKLYISVIGNSTHPFWKHMNLEPSNWSNPRSERLYQELRDWNNVKVDKELSNFHSYLTKRGQWHCRMAAKEQSVFDELWIEVLDKVLLSESSAFAFTRMATQYQTQQNRLPPVQDYDLLPSECVFEVSKDRIRLLYSHVVSGMGLSSEESRVKVQKALSSDASLEYQQCRRVQTLFMHSMSAGNKLVFWDNNITNSMEYAATALQIACSKSDAVAVDAVLRTVRKTCDQTGFHSYCAMMLKPTSEMYDTPFSLVESDAVAELLLEFEHGHVSKAKVDNEGVPLSEQISQSISRWTMSEKPPVEGHLRRGTRIHTQK